MKLDPSHVIPLNARLFVMGQMMTVIVAAAQPALFGFKITSSSAGKAGSTLQFTEIERTSTTSIVELRYIPERSGVDQAQLTLGVCLLMKNRGEQFVNARLIAGTPVRYEVTFPRDVTEQPLGTGMPLSASQCQRFTSQAFHVD